MVALDPDVKRRALATAHALAREAPLCAAYLFGSHAEGRAHQWSDIDVAVFIKGLESWDLSRKTRLIVQIQKEVGFDVEPHLFPASWHENPPRASFAQYILKHGVPLDIEGIQPQAA